MLHCKYLKNEQGKVLRGPVTSRQRGARWYHEVLKDVRPTLSSEEGIQRLACAWHVFLSNISLTLEVEEPGRG